MPTFVGPRAPSAQPGLGAPYVSTTYVNYNMYALTLFCTTIFVFLTLVYLPYFMAFPLFIVPSKFVIYICTVSPYVIIILLPLLILSEDLFPGQVVNHTIFRRRIGDTNGPWEDTHLFSNTFSEEDNDLFTDGMNGFYSSDGFFPQSFNEREPSIEPGFMDRFITQKDIIHYNKITRRRFHRLADVRMRRHKVIPILKKIKPPIEVKHYFTIFPYDDFSVLGSTVQALSHSDASSYIHDFEKPVVFQGRAVAQIRRLRKYKQRTVLFMDNAPFWVQKASYLGYEDKLTFQEEYPVNVDFVMLKRQWQENPSSMTWQDPFCNMYSNLTRFSGLTHTFDWQTDALVFATPSTSDAPIPKEHRSSRNPIKRSLINEHLETTQEFANSNIKASHSIIVPDFMRLGLLAPYLSKFLTYLTLTFAIDALRKKVLYRRFNAGDLESVPFMGLLFANLSKLANFVFLYNKTIKRTKHTSTFSPRKIVREKQQPLPKTPLNISRHKINKFLSRPMNTLVKKEMRDIYEMEQISLRWYRRNFRNDLVREEALNRMSKFSNEKRAIGKWSVLGYYKFFRDKDLMFDDKFSGDSALLPIEYTYDEDRYSSDYEYLANLHEYTQPHFDIEVDNFRSFHLAEYEYLVEEDDFFDQSMSEDLSGLTTLIVCTYFEFWSPEPTIALYIVAYLS
jgi:hypothetical protein